MGHLITVQNLLVLLGAPINLYRRDFPWTTEYYPFPPRLERFSKEALACYIYAEMPRNVHPKLRGHPSTRELLAKIHLGRFRPRAYTPAEKSEMEIIVDEVSQLVIDKVDPDPHRVGALYDEIIHLISDSDLIPDAIFDEDTYVYQASWDDWGRGYKPDPYHLDVEGSRADDADQDPAGTAPSSRPAHVMVEAMATREQAIKALKALSSQGEAPHLREGDTGEPSHFERFIEIYREMRELAFVPVRPVPINPTTRDPAKIRPSGKPAMGDATSAVAGSSMKADDPLTYIEATGARNLAELFNLRYRMLLCFLAHTYSLARVTPTDRPSRRAMVMHRVFGEMYNIKSISGLLMRMPLRDHEDRYCAAPPFEMPFSLILPPDDKEIWRQHLALHEQSKQLCAAIFDAASRKSVVKKHLDGCGGELYLRSLMDLDRRAIGWIKSIISAKD